MGDKSTIKFLTDEEFLELFTTLEKQRRKAETDLKEKCAIRNKAMFAIMYYCALRVSEAMDIRKEDFNVYKNELYCRRKKGGKNNTLRIIPEYQWVTDCLKKHIKVNRPTSYMFTNFIDTSTPLSRKTCDHLMKKACSKTSISSDKWHCHTLRHTKAVNLAEDGLDLKEIQYWLGHASITNTEIYFQFTTSQYETMYKKLRKKKRYPF